MPRFFNVAESSYESLSNRFGFKPSNFKLDTASFIGGLVGFGFSLWALIELVQPALAGVEGISQFEASVITVGIALTGVVECSTVVGAIVGEHVASVHVG